MTEGIYAEGIYAFSSYLIPHKLVGFHQNFRNKRSQNYVLVTPCFVIFGWKSMKIQKVLNFDSFKVKRKQKTSKDVKFNALKYGSMIVEIFKIYLKIKN